MFQDVRMRLKDDRDRWVFDHVCGGERLSCADAAKVLGVSHQRVGQIRTRVRREIQRYIAEITA